MFIKDGWMEGRKDSWVDGRRVGGWKKGWMDRWMKRMD
jgi:hypothetical protein